MGSLGFWLMVAIFALILACLIEMALRWAGREIRRHVDAALSGGQTDVQAPANTDTPIYAQLRHEDRLGGDAA